MIDMHKEYWMGENVVKALDGISLTIDEHEFVAIIGPSGSGKSTLMNMIGCLDTPDSGQYLLLGEDISDLSDDRLAEVRSKRIGFIFQGFNLLHRLTARENVELPLIYQARSASEKHAMGLEALKSVGLEDRMHHRPSELSGGQQQRVAIARALATRPSLILADEPTGNLDSKSGSEVLNILTRLHAEGNTVVLITHDPKVAARSRRIVHIADGQITSDTPNEPVEVTV
jgi:putative ABC transport system ATP-binding protein